jgi:hypothetical protein
MKTNLPLALARPYYWITRMLPYYVWRDRVSRAREFFGARWTLGFHPGRFSATTKILLVPEEDPRSPLDVLGRFPIQRLISTKNYTPHFMIASRRHPSGICYWVVILGWFQLVVGHYPGTWARRNADGTTSYFGEGPDVTVTYPCGRKAGV